MARPPVRVNVNRSGLVPLPLPSPYWTGPALELADLPEVLEASMIDWRGTKTDWTGCVMWHDPHGFNRITWVDGDHLTRV